jgi:hypothetical protein
MQNVKCRIKNVEGGVSWQPEYIICAHRLPLDCIIVQPDTPSDPKS